MTKLPVLSGKSLIKLLSKIGFKPVRTRGSHCILNKYDRNKKITIPVPLHNELAKGTLKAIMRQAEISLDDLLRLLKKKY
ncbi:MAG: type II toxin-antitoxin system HicA family toxin [Candidatus Nanoarchaeia archaeon]